MGFEMRGLQEGLVTRRKTLKELLEEEEPQCRTREGEMYVFDREILQTLAAVATEEEMGRLRLPINLRFHVGMEDQCSLDDEVAAGVLRRLEGFGKAYPFRDGKMWLPYSLGLELILKHRTAIQRIFVP